MTTESEIYQLYMVPFVNYNIFKFYVSVGDVSFVKVLHRKQKLLENFLGFVLWKLSERLSLEVRV